MGVARHLLGEDGLEETFRASESAIQATMLPTTVEIFDTLETVILQARELVEYLRKEAQNG